MTLAEIGRQATASHSHRGQQTQQLHDSIIQLHARGILVNPFAECTRVREITVIIPCLNEEQGIESVLRRMPDFVDEVIVVDNGSTDRTSDVAQSFGAKVIRENVRGYGRGYKTGFASATGDMIITLDGDHSYPPDAISYLLEAFLHLDVDFLNASRFPVRDSPVHELET